jgi:hypothetical protein
MTWAEEALTEGNALRIFARPVARLAVSLAGTAALLAVAAPAPAEAVPLGRACMFVAPKGASGVGHAAFAIKVRGERDHWIYGAFGSTNAAPLNGLRAVRAVRARASTVTRSPSGAAAAAGWCHPG